MLVCQIQAATAALLGKKIIRSQLISAKVINFPANRRAIRRAETLIGSSKMHRFAPTSYAGYIHVCQHSCPKYCVDCVDMNYGKCQWKSYSGEIRKAQVDVKGGNIQFKNSREYYEDRGLEIAGKFNVPYIETSAKDSRGVDEAFISLVNFMIGNDEAVTAKMAGGKKAKGERGGEGKS